MLHAMFDQIKTWARALRADVIALWIAARDPRTPVLAKLVAAIVAGYALSPIDLIPDFVPIFGYLDDLILVPAGIALAVRLIPVPLMDEFRAKAAAHQPRSSMIGACIIVALWIGAGIWLWRYW